MVPFMANIRIKNIYYMLAYAFRSLAPNGMLNLASEEFDNIHDLFAFILSRDIATQVKRGLHRDYCNQTEPRSIIKGKICVSESISRNTLMNKQIVCQFDEFSEDNPLNQILKTTVLLLVKHGQIKIETRKSLRKLLLYFSEVKEIDPISINWESLSYHRNNSSYRLLINVCWLVINGLLLTTDSGKQRLASFIDDQQMHRLFENFVLNYYKREYPHLSANAAYIEWNISEDDNRLFLPIMKSDVTMVYAERTLIIDTKYYAHALQTNPLFDSKSVNSANLYQIFTYVKNKDRRASGNVSGVLLYAKVDEEISPDYDYCIGGNLIGVKTLDLSGDWEAIKWQLDTLINDYLIHESA